MSTDPHPAESGGRTRPTLLVLTSTFPRNARDHEPRFIADLCEHLLPFYRIIVLTQRRPGASRRENLNGIEVIRYRYAPARLELLSESGGMFNTLKRRPATWLLVPLLLTAQLLATWRTVSRFQPSVIHAHWLAPQGLVAALHRRFRSIPLVITAHGSDLYNALYGRPGASRLKRWVMRAADQLCVVSAAMQRHAAAQSGLAPDAIAVCPMGADLDGRFHPGDPGQAGQYEAGRLLYVGRLIERKGVDLLIRALVKLPDCTLVIAGYGPDRDALEQLAEELGVAQRVEFAGRMEHDAVADEMRRAEACIQPATVTEALGLVAVEAMGRGCPVIAGAVPGLGDLVEHEATGLVFEPGNADALAAAVSRLRDDPGLRKRLVENALAFARENYAWPVCAGRYHDLFIRLMRDAP